MLFLDISFRFAWNDISRNKGEVFKIEALNLIDQVGRNYTHDTAKKMAFSIKDFSSKCDQVCGKMRIWSHLLEKPLMEDFIFCAMLQITILRP